MGSIVSAVLRLLLPPLVAGVTAGSPSDQAGLKKLDVIAAVDGHDIDAKVDGFGSMYLKSSIVKKVL